MTRSGIVNRINDLRVAHQPINGFGAYLRSLRKAKGLSMRELERQSEVSQSYITHIERGKKTPSPAILGKLAGVLDVPHMKLMRAAGHVADDKVEESVSPLSVKEFGDYLKNLREEAGLTLARLGAMTGYSTPHLSQVETGKKKHIPTPEYLEKIAKPLRVRYVDLLQLAGYSDLANGISAREVREDAPPDLKSLLEYGALSTYNGHDLTAQDRKRILTVLEALFPEYEVQK